jgi:hypothetical protein
MSGYDKTVTREELLSLNKDEKKALSEKLKSARVQIDSKTFGLYKVWDGVRYDIEPMMDDALRLG